MLDSGANVWRVTFPYNRTLVAVMQQMPAGRSFTKSPAPAWVVQCNPDNAKAMVAAIAEHDISIHPAELSLMKQLAAKW